MEDASSKPGTELQIVEREGVIRLTLDRPARRNALSQSLVAELVSTVGRVAGDPSIRVVVLAATGSVFCAGHDLREMIGRSAEEYDVLFGSCTELMLQLRRLPQPVIARVQGIATAAGCQLVAACDLVVAAEEATFATPGVKLGLFCTTPMVPLVRAVPAKVAMEMLLTGQSISARRAYEIGLVNRVVPAAELDAAVEELVQAILATSPAVVRLGKRAFYEQLALEESAAYEQATRLIAENAQFHDAQEGIKAFVEKRRPTWSGQ
jgi:enoyl-CoA hydratase/carnithine racemase